MTHRPYVVHADWGTAPGKRWFSAARWDGRRYWIEQPELVGSASSFLPEILYELESDAAVVGFDFPIGIPQAYAQKVEANDFPAFLRRVGGLPYERFFDVARAPEQVSVTRPFYPHRPGGTNQGHLVKGLGVNSITDLLRQCERQCASRGQASPLFWTLGAKQVGKAAISGWRDVIRPMLSDHDDAIALWPFDGPLDSLIEPKRCVICETYPAEACVQLGLRAPGKGWSKTSRDDRLSQVPILTDRLDEYGIKLSRCAKDAFEDAFGTANDGEDQFDAFVGLVAMLAIVLGLRDEGYPEADVLRRVEGWIFGQQLQTSAA